jgi:hypothetical protein
LLDKKVLNPPYQNYAKWVKGLHIKNKSTLRKKWRKSLAPRIKKISLNLTSVAKLRKAKL